jgi:hypothetical protein
MNIEGCAPDRPVSDVRNRIAGVACYLLIAAVALTVTWPALRVGRFCILDCANICENYQHVEWNKPGTYLNIDRDSTSARPAEFIAHAPAAVDPDAQRQYWYQDGLVLILMLWIVHAICTDISGRRWLGLVAALGCLTQASFTENYFTLFKCEPFMAAGALGVTWLLWRLLYKGLQFSTGVMLRAALAGCAVGVAWRLGLKFEAQVGMVVLLTVFTVRYRLQFLQLLAVIIMGAWSALLGTAVKETAGAFFGIYAVGAGVLIWGAPLRVREALRRTWWLSLLVAASFTLLLASYLALEGRYSQGGTAQYVIGVRSIAAGLGRLLKHFTIVAAYAWPALALWLVALVTGAGNGARQERRARIAWSLYFWLFAAGFALVYAPWSQLQVRYCLPAHIGLVTATALSLGMALDGVGKHCARLQRLVRGGVAAALLLLAAHAAFGLLVGPLSEGRVRINVDRAYDEMFDYVVSNTPPGGTAYFMYDPSHDESRYNTRFGLICFYHRPDIRPGFPLSVGEIREPGLIAVSEFTAVYNPNRVAVHAQGRGLFYTTIAPALGLREKARFIHEVSVWYTDADAYRGFQYAARWGVPAFWKLRRGSHRFGWVIYEYTPRQGAVNILANGDFAHGLEHWEAWGDASVATNLVHIGDGCVRIENPNARMPGIKQHVAIGLVSGAVYRLSAAARSVGAADPGKVMGARVEVCLPPQPEHDVVWLSQHGAWVRAERVFTNQVNGTAVVVAHLGYGSIAGTNEFADIRLERLPD